MIIINKNSLIHKFNKKFGIKGGWWWDNQVSLCPYFWGTIASILKFVIKSTIFVGVPSVFLTGFGYAIIGDVFGKEVWDTNWVFASPLVGVCAFLSLVLVAFLVCTVFIVVGFSIKWVYKKITNSNYMTEPNIFFEYIKAKKNKFCPRIQIK